MVTQVLSEMFPKVAERVPEGWKGQAKIERFTVRGDGAADIQTIRTPYLRPGDYTRLLVDGVLVMSDTPFEHRTNYGIARMAHGRVLIAGLGLGMILPAVLRKESVESVLVVERSQDVIDLVAPHYEHPKLAVVCADIHEWKPPQGEKYDTIYFDIWATISTDDLKEMGQLQRRASYWKNRQNPNAWVDCWQRDFLLAKKREEARYYR